MSWKAQSVERFTVEREVVGLFLLFPRAGPILCRVYSWEMKALPPQTVTHLCGSDDHVKWRSCLWGYRSFRHKFNKYSVELQIFSRAWLKERRIFTQNAFLVHAQAILEVIEIYVQFHCLSLYRNDWLPSSGAPNEDIVQNHLT